MFQRFIVWVKRMTSEFLDWKPSIRVPFDRQYYSYRTDNFATGLVDK
jgi:hypothetical protein